MGRMTRERKKINTTTSSVSGLASGVAQLTKFKEDKLFNNKTLFKHFREAD